MQLIRIERVNNQYIRIDNYNIKKKFMLKYKKVNYSS